MKYIASGLIAALLVATAAIVAPASAAAPVHHRPSYCHAPIRLHHPESLDELARQFPWTPAELLSEATMCWGFRRPDWNGWTPNLTKLLDGRWGSSILDVRLPKGTRIWLP